MNYVPAPKTTTPRMDMSPLPMQVIYYFFVILKTSVKYVSYIYLILSYFHFVLRCQCQKYTTRQRRSRSVTMKTSHPLIWLVNRPCLTFLPHFLFMDLILSLMRPQCLYLEDTDPRSPIHLNEPEVLRHFEWRRVNMKQL